MAGHTPWREILAKRYNPDEIECLDRQVEAAVAAIELNELRKARNLTQEDLARKLGTRQANVSKLERRADVRVSTLRDLVEAMGGELRITAHFPDADYLIEPGMEARAGR
jgi:DNA-binding Xre family transcriptional regulator